MLSVRLIQVLPLLSSLWLLCQCSSQEPLAQLTEGSALPVLMPAHTPPTGSVRLVDAQNSQDIRHLQRHQGEMLIEQNRRQFLFSALSPLAESAYTLRIPSSVYLRNGNGWHPVRFLPPIDLSLTTSQGQWLQLISQYASHSEEGAELKTIWRTTQEPRWEAQVTVRAANKVAGLIVQVKAPEGHSVLWTARLPKGLSEEFPIPGPNKGVNGLSMVLLPDLVSLISPHTLRMDSLATSTQLTLAESAAESGFYVLLGRPGALLQPSLIAHAQACARDEPSHAMACLRNREKAPATAHRIKLAENVQGRGEHPLAQTVYVRTLDGQFRSAFSIFPGENLLLNQEEDLNILAPDPQGALDVHLSPVASEGVSLPQLAKGSLRLNLSEKTPAFIELHATQHPHGVSWQQWVEGRPEQDWLSPFTLLQKSWPFTARLPAGDYRLKVYTGRAIVCAQDLTIRSGAAEEISCNRPGPTLELSERLTISSFPSLGSELLSAADLKPIEALIEDSKLPPQSFLEHSDESLGIGLRAFPISPTLRDSWLAWKAPQERVRLREFAQFLRDHDSSVQILLQCPPQGFSPADYEWLALQVQPDFIEMYGCPHISSSLQWFQFAQRLQQQMNRPLKFAAALPQPPWNGFSGQVPALFLARPAQTDQKQQWNEVLQGRYSLGLHSELEVLETSPKHIKVRVRSTDTQYAALILQIADQNGPLNHQTLPLEPSIDRELTLTLTPGPLSRWLRISLFGVSRIQRTQTVASWAGNETSIFLLATSNFMDWDRGTPGSP